MLCLDPPAEFALGQSGWTVVLLSDVDLQITTEGDAGRVGEGQAKHPHGGWKKGAKNACTE